MEVKQDFAQAAERNVLLPERPRRDGEHGVQLGKRPGGDGDVDGGGDDVDDVGEGGDDDDVHLGEQPGANVKS